MSQAPCATVMNINAIATFLHVRVAALTYAARINPEWYRRDEQM